MDIPELRNRLLFLASERLSNRPLALSDFKHEVMNPHLSRRPLGESWDIKLMHLGSSNLSTVLSGYTDGPRAWDKSLLALIDDWAKKWSHPSIQPLPTVPTAGAATSNKQIMKKSALIKKNRGEWVTIESDFHSASENDLSNFAKAQKHGYWHEEDALAWANARGKIKSKKQTESTDLESAMHQAITQPVRG